VGVVNVGIMGGTFDPVHNGHLAVAGEAKARLDLGCVIFIPAGRPWLKSERPVTPAEHRFEMVRLAIAPYPDFRISSVEIDRAGPSYTIDTISEVRAEYEAGDELYFILGWDSLAQLPRWREASKLVQMCHLVAVPRPGYTLPDLKALEAEIPGISSRVVLLDSPCIEISATGIRERVARNLPIGDLVPAEVERYVREQGLYRSAS
jgi:nicotinate-nucleotide adenylyltransferase